MLRDRLCVGMLAALYALACLVGPAQAGEPLDLGKFMRTNLDRQQKAVTTYQQHQVSAHGCDGIYQEPRLTAFNPKEVAKNSIIVLTNQCRLYFIYGDKGEAIEFRIGVARDQNFSWSGVRRVGDMKPWPDWHPPAEMRQRQPYLPAFMAGGPANPLGARALYIYEGNNPTLYRIHGSNEPSTIGSRVSSGCFRLLNKDVELLYTYVRVGDPVYVY